MEERLGEIRLLYKRAEEQISKISLLWAGLAETPVNQLRYAGRHLLDALTDSSGNTPERDLDCAENHCKRAIFDAMDAGIVFCLTEIADFRSDYRTVPITQSLSSYPDILRSAREAHEFIEKIREANDSRHEYYEDAMKHYETLVVARNALDDAREEINKHLRFKNIMVRFQYAGLVIGVLALLATVYFGRVSVADPGTTKPVQNCDQPRATTPSNPAAVTTPAKVQ